MPILNANDELEFDPLRYLALNIPMESVTFSPREEIEFGEEAVPQGMVCVGCYLNFIISTICRRHAPLDCQGCWSISCLCCSVGSYITDGSVAYGNRVWIKIYRLNWNLYYDSYLCILLAKME